ncbi:hypothetical protein BC835DRAFT_1279576, partial [Cytidiella melzeri]
CTYDREQLGCLHPVRCCSAAQQMLNNIHIKWTPSGIHPSDSLTLTYHRKENNQRATLAGEKLTFNPSVTKETMFQMASEFLQTPR